MCALYTYCLVNRSLIKIVVIRPPALVAGDQTVETMGSSYQHQSGVYGDWTANAGGGMVCPITGLPTPVVAWLEQQLSYWTYNTDRGAESPVTR